MNKMLGLKFWSKWSFPERFLFWEGISVHNYILTLRKSFFGCVFCFCLFACIFKYLLFCKMETRWRCCWNSHSLLSPQSSRRYDGFSNGQILLELALNKVRAIRCVKNILIGCLHCVDSLDNCQPSPSLVLHRSGYRGQCLEKRSLGGEAAGLEITRKERRGKTQGEKCLWVAG